MSAEALERLHPPQLTRGRSARLRPAVTVALAVALAVEHAHELTSSSWMPVRTGSQAPSYPRDPSMSRHSLATGRYEPLSAPVAEACPILAACARRSTKRPPGRRRRPGPHELRAPVLPAAGAAEGADRVGRLARRARHCRPSRSWPAATASAASSSARRWPSSRTTARSSASSGRGTFVAQPKLDSRAGGLSRLLVVARPPASRIEVLDLRDARTSRARSAASSESVDGERGPADHHPALARRLPVASATRSSAAARSAGSSRRPARPRRARGPRPGRHGVQLGSPRSPSRRASAGSSRPTASASPTAPSVFLALCTSSARAGRGTRPFEVARVEYRGDLVQFRLEVSAAPAGGMQALWELTPPPAGA